MRAGLLNINILAILVREILIINLKIAISDAKGEVIVDLLFIYFDYDLCIGVESGLWP